MSENDEITICPHCGSNLSDPEYVKKFNRSAIISWTGKQMCPNCHYYGFFLSVPRSQFEKMTVSKEPYVDKEHLEMHEERVRFEQSGWLTIVVAICILSLLIYFLATSM